MSAREFGRVSDTLAADLARCDAQPIHAPGSIQAHGALLVVEPETGRIRAASDNLEVMCGRSAAEVLGRPLAELVGAELATTVEQASKADRPSEPSSLRAVIGGRAFDASNHRRGAISILELEPEVSWAHDVDAQLRSALVRLQGANGLAELHAIAASTIHDLARFERVMVYRFDEDEHGEVIAEVRADDLDPYLGLHYPASDIPARARQLYLRSWLRLIPDARGAPVPLLAPDRGGGAESIDLGGAVLRSVPPVHLEYLANMGVRASMSVSIVVRGRLWGLIACHHREVRLVPYRVRAACELIGRLVSLQIAALEELDERRVWSERQEHLERAVTAAEEEDDVFAGLARAPEDLLALIGAGGAAVVLGGELVARVGHAPSGDEVEALAAWLGEQHPEGYRSHSLPAEHEPGQRFRDRASGLLAVAIPRPAPSFLLFFRPEQIETVSWGGDPRRTIEDVDSEGRIHPRRSFATWRETVEGSSRRWIAVEMDLAAELKRRLVELDLARQVERARAAVQARDELVAIVSHDLRSPLGVIQMQVELAYNMLASQSDEPARRMRAAFGRIQRSANRMTELVTDLLDLAKIEAGRFTIEADELPASALIEEAMGTLEPLAEHKGVELQVSDSAPARVLADPERIFQVMSNVIGNAIKFTPAGGAIRIGFERQGPEVCFQVADTGQGVAPEDLPRLFDRYWRSRRASATGTGLGLFIVKGIVESHGGRVWAASEPGRGTTISFTLRAA